MSHVSQYIFINSKDRVIGSASDFQINIKDIQNDFENIELTLQKVSIPRSYYPINSSNNVITCSLGDFTLTPGNYTIAQLITEFNSKTSIVLSHSTTTGKMGFAVTGAFSITGAYKYLGLATGAHAGTGSFVSDNVADLSGPSEINLITDIPLYSTNSLTGNRDRLISIYPNCSFGDYINFTISNFAPIKLATNNISMQSFSLRDETGTLIDLNGLDWSFTLLLSSSNLRL